MLGLDSKGIEERSISEIIRAVDSCIEKLCADFQEHPSYYFTENDLVCKFYQLFISEIGDYRVKGCDEKYHQIIHMEYPTPFKCSMKGTDFILMANDSHYRRGHFDIAILNPEIINLLSFEEVRSQKFQLVLNNVLGIVNQSRPMILYALEFVFHRDKMKNGGPAGFGKKINQDHLKLINANRPGTTECGKDNFVQNYLTVAFLYDSTQKNNIRQFVKNDDGRIRYQSCDSNSNHLR